MMRLSKSGLRSIARKSTDEGVFARCQRTLGPAPQTAPWAADAAAIWEAHHRGQIRAFAAAFSLPTIFYIVRKQAGLAAARTAVEACLTTLDIVPTDQATLLAAQALAGSDFEDDLQAASAVQAGVDAIVTRDPRGFASSRIPALTASDVAATLPGSAKP
jgi:predicted nucleic acid-binding protein